jgi:signal transduction histidine kinase
MPLSPFRRARRVVSRYVFALLSVVLALLIRFWTDPHLGADQEFVTFLAAVAVTTWFAGLGPALLTLALGALASMWFFVDPRGAILGASLPDLVGLTLYVAASLVIVVMGQVLRRARRLAERSREEVRRLNAILEDRVRERTGELREALRDLEGFAYSIAHDLRAPLRAMSGMAQILQDDYPGKPLDAAGLAHAGRIVEAAQRMDALIGGLLSYSRLTREEVVLAPADLEAVVLSTKARLGPELRTSKGEIVVEAPLPRVYAHVRTLSLAVGNLLSNALKFTAPGVPPRVRVRAERREGKVILSIEDNGIGIAPEHQERVFGVFQTLHPRGRYGGVGIGLAIAQKAVVRMGGRLGVESVPERGSRFWIELREAAGAEPRPLVHRSLSVP